MTNYVDMLPAYTPGYGLPKPWAQYTAAVVAPPPGSDVIPEWEFFYGIAQRMGLQLEFGPTDFGGGQGATLPLDMEHTPDADWLLEILTTGSRVPLDEVKAHPGGLSKVDPTIVVLPKEDGWEGRLDLANELMMDDLAVITARGHGDLARGRVTPTRSASLPPHELALQLRRYDRTAPGRRAHEPGVHAPRRSGR
jgi:hypothetical protein